MWSHANGKIGVLLDRKKKLYCSIVIGKQKTVKFCSKSNRDQQKFSKVLSFKNRLSIINKCRDIKVHKSRIYKKTRPSRSEINNKNKQ